MYKMIDKYLEVGNVWNITMYRDRDEPRGDSPFSVLKTSEPGVLEVIGLRIDSDPTYALVNPKSVSYEELTSKFSPELSPGEYRFLESTIHILMLVNSGFEKEILDLIVELDI